MNWFLQRLFLFDKFEIKTSLSKEKINNKIETFLEIEDEDYYGKIEENGFCVAERNSKHFGKIGFSRNPYAPVAKAKIKETDNGSVISVTIRMNYIVLFVFVPLYVLSLCMIKTNVIFFPVCLIMLHFGFFMPAKILKKYLVDMLAEG